MPYGVVYLVLNHANDKCYVGQTNRPKRRWAEHCHDANRNHPRKMSLHHAIKKHGRRNFSYEILGEATDQIALDNLERLWIIVLRANQKSHGYNRTYGGDGAFRHLPETKVKIAEASRKIIRTPEMCAHMSTIQRGKVIPQEQREKISRTLKGRGPSDEIRAKAAEASHLRKGVPLTEKHKANMRKPKNLSPEMLAWKSQKARADMLRIWEERHR